MSLYCVGLTGGLASGKSTAGKIFQSLGIVVVDTDTIAADLTAANGKALAPLRQALGDWAFTADGLFDRAAVRRHIFIEKSLRLRLEAVLHPMIRQQLLEQLQKADSCYVVGVVPLMQDKPTWKTFFHRILAIDIDEDKQIMRAKKRDKAQDAKNIIATQPTAAERCKIADDIIYNNGSVNNFSTAITDLHHRYIKLATNHYNCNNNNQ